LKIDPTEKSQNPEFLEAIEADIKATYERQPRMAMVDSHKAPAEGFFGWKKWDKSL
jgi:monomeric isocitrate dehydrogenase